MSRSIRDLRRLTTWLLAILMGALVFLIPLASAGSAQAASLSTWERVAACESSGDWQANTGNGFYGGLQFTASTWAAYGGGQYASEADQATEQQQIAIAEKVLASQGPQAWPVCSVQAGLTAGGTPAVTDPAGLGTTTTSTSAGASAEGTTNQNASGQSTVPQQGDTDSSSQAPQHKANAPAANSATDHATQAGTDSAHTYTVQAGDTLSGIAAHFHVTGGWHTLYASNHSALGGNPNLIYPGQQLAIH